MHLLLSKHYDVQTGMYFDYSTSIRDWRFFLSNIIEDSFWNYAVIPENCNLDEELTAVEEVLRKANRPLAVYVIDDKEHLGKVTQLIKNGYNKISEESFMTYTSLTYRETIHKEVDVIRAIDKAEINDFIEVFMNAYGGEITPEQPYGELDKTYVEALTRSFKNTEKFYHYVCYSNGEPVSIASLCYDDKGGGIYNVGTNPNNRGCGYGTTATIACIDKWKKLGGETLFLQTETGSKVESWYYSLGFKPVFHGSIYYKEK